jgi:hypothetical protein
LIIFVSFVSPSLGDDKIKIKIKTQGMQETNSNSEYFALPIGKDFMNPRWNKKAVAFILKQRSGRTNADTM